MLYPKTLTASLVVVDVAIGLATCAVESPPDEQLVRSRSAPPSAVDRKVM